MTKNNEIKEIERAIKAIDHKIKNAEEYGYEDEDIDFYLFARGR